MVFHSPSILFGAVFLVRDDSLFAHYRFRKGEQGSSKRRHYNIVSGGSVEAQSSARGLLGAEPTVYRLAVVLLLAVDGRCLALGTCKMCVDIIEACKTIGLRGYTGKNSSVCPFGGACTQAPSTQLASLFQSRLSGREDDLFRGRHEQREVLATRAQTSSGRSHTLPRGEREWGGWRKRRL